MTTQHPEDHPLSDELRVTLCQVLAVGFLDRMTGFHVEDGGLISTDDANAIFGLAEKMVDNAAPTLADAYRESPEAVHAALYLAGSDAADKVETAAVSRN